MTDQEDWATDAGKRLRDAELHTPGDVQQQLQATRRAAVSAAQRPRPQSPWPAAAAGGGVLATAALVIVLASNPEVLRIPNLSEQELAAAQEVELLEDLEFVAWMVAMEESDEDPNQG